jgi:DNA modification methylase
LENAASEGLTCELTPPIFRRTLAAWQKLPLAKQRSRRGEGPPFNSNRNCEVFWGETKEKRAFEDRHESTRAYIDYMRPRCVQLARVLKKTGSFYYHCDWHASHYVKVMLDQILEENNSQIEMQ